MADEKVKKTRAKRRNYEHELSSLRNYCEIKRDVLKSLDGDGKDPLWRSSIEAYEDILKRMDNGSK